MNFFALVDH